MTTRLNQVLGHLQRVLAPTAEGGPSDGQLLARFLAGRDEPSFATLVRRHGGMVWRLCLRVLGHVQDAEDAFQATFVILACKAASVRKQESVGSWLFGVAYRTACEARAARSRRRARERQVENMPEPTTPPAEPADWQPWLDHELNGLPEKYRAVIVACDLEGRSRKETARLLGLAEGTLSSRLARARLLLARRLARHGVTLSGAALAAALSEGAASAVPPLLAASTGKTAVLVAAGQRSAVSASVGVLVKGVLKTMLVAKLRVMVGALMVVLAMGAGGVAYRAAGPAGPTEKQPLTEVEALRRENELLKLNLEVVLEKVRAQEAEVRKLRAEAHDARRQKAENSPNKNLPDLRFQNDGNRVDTMTRYDLAFQEVVKSPPQTNKSSRQREEALRHLEAALKALRDSNDAQSQQDAARSVEKALQWLGRQQEQQTQPRNPQKQ